ncbi:MAG: hypothetical protein MJ088_02075 [Clostridia bacterium]|nr:hypothetical protein [Clostridia bacterium]
MREEDAARGELARITAEYERLAFAPIEDGLVKPADKLRALAEYARLVGMREEGPALTVLYDYGGGDFAADEAQRVPPRTPEEGSDDA